MPRVLVTDAGRGSAIAIIRSLGRQGWRVTAADADRRSPGFRSRYVDERLVYPAPEAAPEAMTDMLLRTVEASAVDLVIPVTDEVAMPVSAERERFEEVSTLALPAAGALMTAANKHQTLALASRLEVPVPRTALVLTVPEAVDRAAALGWPVVLKPLASRVYRQGGGVEAFHVGYASSPEELARQMSALEGRCAVLLQEFYDGVGHGVELLLHRGRPLAAFQHRRLREVPVTGGASSYRESVALDGLLLDDSIRLLSALDWTGLAMVEFKVAPSGHRLMEVNGRIWGSLPLAVKAGMDFPARAAALYLSGPPDHDTPLATDYRVGVRSRNLDLEVLWIGAALQRRRRPPDMAPMRRRDGLLVALRLLDHRDGYDILSVDDPYPGIAELGRIARKLPRKLRPTPPPPSLSRTLQRSPRRVARAAAIRMAGSTAFARAVDQVERTSRERQGVFAVLTYHRVDQPEANPHLTPGLLSATPEAFDDHLQSLTSRHRFVSLEEVLEACAGGTPLPPRALLVTFDDAYRDFAQHAWPILRRRGVPVVLFVPTAYPDHPERVFWWDRLAHAVGTTTREAVETPVGVLHLNRGTQRPEALRRLRDHVKSLPHEEGMALVDALVSRLGVADLGSSVLGWEELRNLHREGVTLAAHSRTHAMLDRIPTAQLVDEVAGSFADLEERIGSVPPAFAYPSGQWDERTVAAVRKAGAVVAFTTERGTNHLGEADRLRLRRINVGRASSGALLRAQVLRAPPRGARLG